MRQPLLCALLFAISLGLLMACSKTTTTPTPANPLVGQFDINRVELTDFPTSYTAYNSVITSATALGTDTFVFGADNMFTNNYSYTTSGGAMATNTQTGSYVYASTTQVVTLTPTPQNGQAVQPYAFLYSSTANELSTGKLARQDSVPNPTTGKNQLVSYNINYVYKKK